MPAIFDIETCPYCVKKVTEYDKYIQCEGDCKRWFHAACIKMPAADYQKYAKDCNKNWLCNREDCVTNGRDPISTLTSQIANLLKIATNLATKYEVSGVNIGIEGLKNDLQDINKKLNELEPWLKNTEQKLDKMEAKVNNMNLQQASQNLGPDDVIGEINDRSRRARNLIVYNLPEVNSPALEVRLSHDKKAVSQLFVAIGSNLACKDIKPVRLGKPNKGKQAPKNGVTKRSGCSHG